MLGHLLGMFEQQADAEERTRQFAAAAGIAQQTGGLPLDEMTALQVREHADLSTDGVDSIAARRRSDERSPGAARRPASSVPQRSTSNCPASNRGRSVICSTSSIPATRGCTASTSAGRRAVRSSCRRRTMAASSRRRRGMGTPASAAVHPDAHRRRRRRLPIAATAGPQITLDAVEFCRTVSGREAGDGILNTPVPF